MNQFKKALSGILSVSLLATAIPFSLSATETPSTEPFQAYGKAEYSIKDMLMLTKYLSNKPIKGTPSAEQMQLQFDLNLDSELTTADITEVAKILVGFTKAPSPVRDISSLDLVDELVIGWNLGNTFDAHSATLKDPTPEKQETLWGNPVTTKAMIDTLKDAGFNTIRVPVTWYPMTGEAPDYEIKAEWLDRVQEVVDYVIDNDMYCILNTHHEGSWLEPLPEKEEELSERIAKVWTQIAQRFAGYDEKLIFEGLNEPRTEGSTNEWSGGTQEECDVLYALEQVFVDTVRATGGNNTYRHLMAATYAASVAPFTWNTSAPDFVMPNDPSNKIIVSMHTYSPYNFALNMWDDNQTNEWGADEDRSSLSWEMESLYNRFGANGIPVILGEFGAVNRPDVVDEETGEVIALNEDIRADWVNHYITEAKKYGMKCVWWDNGVTTGNGERFGIFNRRTLEFDFPVLLEAIMEAAYQE
jgi:endoglucanase